MTEYNLDREQLFKLAGIVNAPDAYTPVTVGKQNKLVQPRNVWAYSFQNVNFIGADELKQNHVENVQCKPVYVEGMDGQHKLAPTNVAIVGEDSNDIYAIHSNRYKPVQHNVIIDAMCYACEDTGLDMFGHVEQSKGRFDGFGTIRNPDVHMALGERYDDPVMLGMRFHNSHMGDEKFGGTMFGIRGMCGNYMALGSVLGEIGIKHYRGVEDVAHSLGNVLRGFVDKIEAFKDKVHYIREEVLSPSEQESVMWGLKFNPLMIENVLSNMQELNPEVQDMGKVSGYDLYNTTTAFITYRVGGNHMVKSNLDLSERVANLFNRNIDTLIEEGRKAKERYEEQEQNRVRSAVTVKVVA